MHLPQVQCTVPTSQDKEQTGHCISEEISHSSKYSELPMLVINAFDFPLNGLNFSVRLVHILYQRVTVWVRLELLNQSLYDFLAIRVFFSGLLSEVYLAFCNQHYRDEFPSTSLCEFLRDACDEFPRTS